MDLSNVLEMDKDEAAEHATSYREIKMPTEEDKWILAIFTALAAGKQVVDVVTAVRDAGRDEHGYPKLAFGPVKAPWCYLASWKSGCRFYPTNSSRCRSSLDVENMPGGESVYASSWNSKRTQTPIVPPTHRRWGHRSWFILWEVEEWAQAPIPPGDPILLRPLLGTLYTVEACWDLTEVERLVLGQRP